MRMSEYNVYLKIMLPLSKPILATLSLFYAVGRWNGFSDALMYLRSSDSRIYWPIQLLLYNIIRAATQTSEQNLLAENVKPESIFRSEWGQKIQFSSRTDQRRKQRGVRMAGGGVC